MQAASLAVFLVLYWCFRFQLSHRRYLLDSEHTDVYQSRKFRIYFIGISPIISVVRVYLVGFILTIPSPPRTGVQLAAGLLLLRAVIRIIQFSDGLDSKIAQSEMIPLVLDSLPVLAASIAMTAMPPGVAFQSAWEPTSPTLVAGTKAIHLGQAPIRVPDARRVISRPYQAHISTLYAEMPPAVPYPSPTKPPTRPPRSPPPPSHYFVGSPYDIPDVPDMSFVPCTI